MPASQWNNQTVYRRQSPASVGTLDREGRTVDAVIATGTKVDGPFGPEVLNMTADAVDLSRASSGLPWHDDHGPRGMGERIGVAMGVRLADGVLKGTLRATRNPPGDAALNDIEDGIITHTSVGYRILDAVNVDGVLHITRWQPIEVSTPSVVADTNSTIQRTLIMPDPTPPVVTDPPDPNAVIEAARTYAAALDAAFAPFPDAGALRTRAFAESWTVERANQELLAFVGGRYQRTAGGIDAVAGEDAVDKFALAAGQAIETRAGLIRGDEARTIRRDNEFFGYSLAEVAREYLRVAGDRTRGDSRQIVGAALTRAGIISHGTSDFANILLDASNKAMQIAYMEAPETFETWTRPGELPDFKTAHRPQMSTFSDLEAIGENGEFTYGSFSDAKETILLGAYGKLFSITRVAIINDDLQAFTRAPAAMARAAKRKIGDAVYLVLSTNAAMSDGNALFSAAHSNYVAATSGAAPSVATLDAAYTAMATQTDPAGNTLNAVGSYILIPHALRGTTDALLASVLNPAEGGTTAFQATNVWANRLEPVYEARIDADDAAKWYLAGNPNVFETVEVAYLNGVQEPRMEREEGFTVDGVTLKVAHDFGVAPIDWRFLYHNDGN